MCSKSMAARQPPVIIGGVGGSGTRVVAEILLQSGYFLGQDLNRENDNLLFTYLFKHPRPFGGSIDRVHPRHRPLLTLHERLFFGRLPVRPDDIYRFIRAAWETHRGPTYRWKWGVKRLNRLVRARRVDPVAHWGWKEPTTIYHLHGLAEFYPDAKLILVMRNGLDMAYSSNAQQHCNWGQCFGIDPGNLAPSERFRFWQRANQRTIDTASRLFDSFLVVRLEDLCREPARTTRQLLDFVGLEGLEPEPHVLQIPKLPSSHGRFLRHDTSWLDDECRQSLEALGYGRLWEADAASLA